MKIHKFICELGDPLGFTRSMHPWDVILTSQAQRNNSIAVWYQTNGGSDRITRSFRWIRTGEIFDGTNYRYIATVNVNGWIGHLYEIN